MTLRIGFDDNAARYQLRLFDDGFCWTAWRNRGAVLKLTSCLLVCIRDMTLCPKCKISTTVNELLKNVINGELRIGHRGLKTSVLSRIYNNPFGKFNRGFF